MRYAINRAARLLASTPVILILAVAALSGSPAAADGLRTWDQILKQADTMAGSSSALLCTASEADGSDDGGLHSANMCSAGPFGPATVSVRIQSMTTSPAPGDGNAQCSRRLSRIEVAGILLDAVNRTEGKVHPTLAASDAPVQE